MGILWSSDGKNSNELSRNILLLYKLNFHSEIAENGRKKNVMINMYLFTTLVSLSGCINDWPEKNWTRNTSLKRER